MSFRGKVVRIHQLTIEPPGVLKVKALFVDELGAPHGMAQLSFDNIDSIPEDVRSALGTLVKALERTVYINHFEGPAPGQASSRDVKPKNLLEQLRDDDADGDTRQG